ncbi:hypothetical protein BDY24DRAFT_187623 [Mrakia frigida]|uniref:uncharacterized protein n=1 Tax=Mrakia frigida TaxID=29902 RepID=UPI003FCC0070
MIPYPIERSTSTWTPTSPPKPRTSSRGGGGGRAGGGRRGLPSPSAPSEDFEEFVFISPLANPPSSSSPSLQLKHHLARKIFPHLLLGPVRAQEFEERAYRAREEDARRGRVLRYAEGVEERAEGWRKEEREGIDRALVMNPTQRTPSTKPHVDEQVSARRSRSPKPRSQQQPKLKQQHPDFNLVPPPPASLVRPSIGPVQPSTRPQSSYHPPQTQATPQSTHHHFHIDSSSKCSSSDERPSAPRSTRHSGDLRNREYVVRKRNLLTHPVEAMREGRVRRGGDQAFGSEEEEEEEEEPSAGVRSFRREVERERVSKQVSVFVLEGCVWGGRRRSG